MGALPCTEADAAPPWPRIESNDAELSVGSARPLEDAARVSIAPKIDKRYLPVSDSIYRNVHADLREKATAYRTERGEP